MNLRGIAESVCRIVDVKIEDVLSESRLASLVEARHIIAHIARGKGAKYAEIGRFLNRDRTTMISSDRAAKRLAEVDAGFRRMVERAAHACRPADMPAAAVPGTIRRHAVAYCGCCQGTMDLGPCTPEEEARELAAFGFEARTDIGLVCPMCIEAYSEIGGAA